MLQILAKILSKLRGALSSVLRAFAAPFGSPNAGYAPPLVEAEGYVPEDEYGDLSWEYYTPDLPIDAVRLRDLAIEAIRGRPADPVKAGISEPLQLWFASLDQDQLRKVSTMSALHLFRHLKHVKFVDGLPRLPHPRRGNQPPPNAKKAAPAQTPSPPVSAPNTSPDADYMDTAEAASTSEIARRLDTLFRDPDALRARIAAARAQLQHADAAGRRP